MESRINGLIIYMEGDSQTEQCKVRFWCRDLVVPITFVANKDSISHLKVGSWISVCADEIRERNIVDVDLISDIVPTKVIRKRKAESTEFAISLKVCLVFPPSEWACINGYCSLAFCEHIGVVGNFAPMKLREVNDNIEQNVCYEAEIVSFDIRSLSNKYRTIWAIKQQKLNRIENDGFLKQCPWNENFGDSDSNDALVKDKNEYQSENTTESSINDKNLNEREPIPMVISVSEERLLENKKLVEGVNIGIVVKNERNLIIVYGKNHGLVSIDNAQPLTLRLGDWINYDCIADNESNADASVRHIVYDWKRIDDRPCVAKVIKHKFVNLHTKIRLLDDHDASDLPRVPQGYSMAECDSCDRILVKNTRTIRNNLTQQFQVDAVLEFNDEIYPGFYWIVSAIYKDGISIKIDDDDIDDNCENNGSSDNINDQARSSHSTAEEVEKQKPIENEIAKETNEPQCDLRLKVEGGTNECGEDQYRRLLEKKEKEANEDEITLEMSSYVIDNEVKRCAMAIFVRKMKNYGIIWSHKYKSIIVPIEHCSDLNVGIWVKAKVSAITNGTKYHYITRKPIAQIAEKVPLRCQDGIVQIRVHLERGGEQITCGKHTYFGKKSEVGRVLIDYNRNDGHYSFRLQSSDQEKRLLAWATFVENSDSYDWIVVYQECLIEIDDDNNEIGKLSTLRYDIDRIDSDPIPEAEASSKDIDESDLNVSKENHQNESSECRDPLTPQLTSHPTSNTSLDNQTVESKQQPMRALQKIFGDNEVRKFIESNGYGKELNIVLDWIEAKSK